MRKYQLGFTLVELVAVITIVGVVSIVATPRFSNAGSAALAGRDDLVSALFYVQQIAMARSRLSSDPAFNNPIQIQITGGNLIEVTEGISAAVRRSINMPAGVTIAPNIIRVFTKLGITTETNFTVTASDGSNAVVLLEASGYAH